MKYTWRDVYLKAKVNPSTSTFQRDKFIEFFPFSGSGRTRKYGDESVVVLSIISKMYSENKTSEEIRETLDNRFGIPMTSDLTINNDNSTTTQQVDFLGSIRDIFTEELNKRDATILHLQKELTDIKESLQLLHEKARNRAISDDSRDIEVMSMMRSLMDEKERIQQQRKWWHIFSRK